MTSTLVWFEPLYYRGLAREGRRRLKAMQERPNADSDLMAQYKLRIAGLEQKAAQIEERIRRP